MSKAGLKEVRDFGGVPGIVLEAMGSSTYVAMLPHMKTGQIANPYFLEDFSYNRSEKFARVRPRGGQWVTLPLTVIAG